MIKSCRWCSGRMLPQSQCPSFWLYRKLILDLRQTLELCRDFLKSSAAAGKQSVGVRPRDPITVNCTLDRDEPQPLELKNTTEQPNCTFTVIGDCKSCWLEDVHKTPINSWFWVSCALLSAVLWTSWLWPPGRCLQTKPRAADWSGKCIKKQTSWAAKMIDSAHNL